LKTQNLAGRIVVGLINDCLNNGKSLNQETTLTGKTIISNIKKAKESGYKIHLFYIGVSSVQVSIDRVKTRVDNGGHGVPLENLLRRYEASFENLRKVLPLCDRIIIYDNSEKEDSSYLVKKPLLYVCGNTLTLNKDIPKYMQGIISEYVSTL